MRGPLFSGAVGHKLTLERLAALVNTAQPLVVLSTVWLAEALASRFPVHLIVEPRRQRAAERARRRVERAGGTLTVTMAGEELPLRDGSVGALVVDDLAELENDDAWDYLVGLVPCLRPGALMLALDGTKDPHTESRIAGAFLAAALQALGQERPREGALITVGAAPAAAVVATLTTLTAMTAAGSMPADAAGT